MRGTNIYKDGVIFLPISTTYPTYKVTIGGIDVSDYVPSCEVIRVTTDRLSYCKINLDNYRGRYNGEWTGGEAIKVYLDYATSATYTTHVPTNQIFEGKLDFAKAGLTASGHIMEVSGRERPELADVTLTIDFDSVPINNAIKQVITAVNTKLGYNVVIYTSSSIESTSKTTSVNYREQKIITILSDLCRRAGFDSRIDVDGTFNAFTSGSKKCYKESVASGINVILCPPAGKDTNLIKNYVKVYGPEKEGCMIMNTKKATTFTPWRKDLIINDTSNQNRAQCGDRANKEYDNLSDAETIESASPVCIGMPYLREGDYVRAFIEYTDIDGWYVVKQISHLISMTGAESRLTLGELEKDGLELIKNNERDIREKQTFNNPNEMEDSYHFTFEDDTNIATHSNTETSEGKLKLVTGQDTGSMTTDAITLPDGTADMHWAEVRFNGNDDCDLCTFDVSFNDGDDYAEVIPGTKGEPGEQFKIIKSGVKIRLRINMKSSTALPNPAIESAVLLFK